MLADLASNRKNMLKVSRAIFIGRRPDSDEKNVSRSDRGGDVGRELETPVLLVLSTRFSRPGS